MADERQTPRIGIDMDGVIADALRACAVLVREVDAGLVQVVAPKAPAGVP